jgi:RNA polymerase sigma-70 factor (ECF subfamily)
MSDTGGPFGTIREALLLRRLRAREERAFEEMVATYRDRIFGLILRMVGNREEAEDLAQEVFITVLKSIDTFRGESKFSTWLYRIAANHTKNRMKYLQRRAYKATSEYDEAAERAVQRGDGPGGPRLQNPESAMAGAQIERVVQGAIAELDEDHRELVVLRDMEEMSYEEIVAITGLNEGTVKSRLHRARTALKEIVQRKMQGDAQ